jgi:hypothetical protein
MAESVGTMPGALPLTRTRPTSPTVIVKPKRFHRRQRVPGGTRLTGQHQRDRQVAKNKMLEPRSAELAKDSDCEPSVHRRRVRTAPVGDRLGQQPREPRLRLRRSIDDRFLVALCSHRMRLVQPPGMIGRESTFGCGASSTTLRFNDCRKPVDGLNAGQLWHGYGVRIRPAATLMVSPVIIRASSETRNSIVSTTSRTSPR